MNKKPLFLGLFLFCICKCFCQEGPVVCTTERNNDGSYSIYADNKSFTDYTVKLIFTDLSGYETNLNPGSLAIATRGKTQIAKLTHISNYSAQANFRYRYEYWPGVYLHKKPDSNFVYLMPSTAGNILVVSKVGSIEERIGKDKPADFYGIGFNYKPGDTICAARAGIVYETNDGVKEGEKPEEYYNSNRNKIYIWQKDETMAHYSILAPIKLLVAPGDKVVPGQPIAVFERTGFKFRVLFNVAYLDEGKIATTQGPVEKSHVYSELTPIFHAGNLEKPDHLQLNKEYQVQQPKEIVAMELSKKERKKMGLTDK
jgi:hypothetical protein